jgi:hypothetical protein
VIITLHNRGARRMSLVIAGAQRSIIAPIAQAALVHPLPELHAPTDRFPCQTRSRLPPHYIYRRSVRATLSIFPRLMPPRHHFLLLVVQMRQPIKGSRPRRRFCHVKRRQPQHQASASDAREHSSSRDPCFASRGNGAKSTLDGRATPIELSEGHPSR